MAPFKIEARARRHHAAPPPAAAARRPARGIVPLPHDEARAGHLLRGLSYGLPIGLLMWLCLALLLWRLA